ncbi:DNA-3-methyladenine glycosylase [Agrococcus carbonis]|uniref:Putative 3-methyladenine DNA glycosylase n=1 Tax=Agrococcus carbonis TaxID=684552 RepID=A0A1H1S4N5_9MICO|nr:DNA-3-methyladenine glycosylase [Agrococcus carbonis]SDS43060.1 DNA-3-methyladenine glycosylase [Agrococcus carbonis]
MLTPDATWFERDPLELAPLLLGGVLRRADAAGTVALRLTEVEAYRGSDDPGAHTFRGKTARNATMFGPGGHVYCYFTYGMHHAVNIVAGPEGLGWGVLVRAGSVVEGHDLAAERRHVRRSTRIAGELARGPGNVAQALGATLADDGAPLVPLFAGRGGRAAGAPVTRPAPHPDRLDPQARAELTAPRAGRVGGAAAVSRPPVTWSFEPAPTPPPHTTGPRVGVSGPGGDASAYPWRFWIPGEPSVSAYRPAAPRKRS